MTILENSDLDLIYVGTRQTLGTAIQEPKLMRLGNPKLGNQVRVKNAESGDYVWVRPVDETQEAIPALNLKLPKEDLVYNAFVLVKPYGDKLEIDRRAPENRFFMGDVAVPPQTTIDTSRVDFGLIRPTEPASMVIQVNPGVFYLEGTAYQIKNAILSSNFTATVSGITTDKAKAVRIDYDPINNEIVETIGVSEFNDSLTHRDAFNSYYPRTSISSSKYALGWLRLYASMTSITRNDIFFKPEWFSKSTETRGEIITYDGEPISYNGYILRLDPSTNLAFTLED